MKFKEYINENNISNLDTVIADIKKDCNPFLKKLNKDYTKNDYFVTGRQSYDDILLKSIRTDRNPRDTIKWIHDIMDDAFYSKFGINYRSNSIFCYPYSYNIIKSTQQYQYGNGFMLFPVGKFEIVYNKEFTDLYLKINDYIQMELNLGFKMKISPEKYPKEVEMVKTEIKKLVDGYKKWNGENIAGSNPECMVNAKKAWLINLSKYLIPMKKLDYFLENLLK